MENASKVKKPTGARYSDEVRVRAVRMVLEHQHEYETQCAAMRSIAAKMGMSRETLRNWVIQAERDRGQRSGSTTADRARLKELEREVRELRTGPETPLSTLTKRTCRRRNGADVRAPTYPEVVKFIMNVVVYAMLRSNAPNV